MYLSPRIFMRVRCEDVGRCDEYRIEALSCFLLQIQLNVGWAKDQGEHLVKRRSSLPCLHPRP